MIKGMTPESKQRYDQIIELLKAGCRTNSEIAAELKVSSALTHHYTAYMAKCGILRCSKERRRGSHVTFVWSLVDKDGLVRDSESKKRAKPVIKITAPRLTNWVGGNPYERLAA